ncbi:MAG: thioredoxin-related protein [Planctomycetota bacterium]|jgi:thioredoxin-related protein
MKHVWTTLAITAASALSLPLNAATPANGSTESATASAALSTALSSEGWVADFDVAVKQAREQGKNLLVDFTGSDWCGWCIKLDEEVFSHESWSSVASKEYIFVSLDFPRSEEAKSKVPNPERNAALQAKYAVTGFPSILLMTVDGDVFGRTGYAPGGPEAYLTHMAELKAEGMPKLMEVTKLVTAYEAAEGEARKAAFATILARLEEIGAEGVGSGSLITAVRAAMDSDADGSKGIRMPAMKALLGAGVSDAELLSAAMTADPKNTEGLYERVVLVRLQSIKEDTLEDGMASVAAFDALGVHQDAAVAFEIYVAGAFFAKQHIKDIDLSRAYAKKGLAIGYEGNPQWTSMLENMAGE